MNNLEATAPLERMASPQFNGWWEEYYSTPEKLVSDAFELFEHNEAMSDEACEILGLPLQSPYSDAGAELLAWGVDRFGFGPILDAIDLRAVASMDDAKYLN